MAEPDSSCTGGGLTARSLLIGLLLVFAICVGGPFSIWTLGSSEITWSFFPVGVGFPFICLILLNAAAGTLRRSWALRPSELVTIMVMGLVATGIPAFICGYLLAIPTTPYYFASPENQWGQYILPHLPAFLVPGNEGMAMTWFFEGLPPGREIPWGTLLSAWAMPLFWWLSFIWTLYLVSFCLVVILRKQWVETERLAFPLMEVPRALLSESDGGRLPGILRSRLLWAGAAVPLVVVLWNIVGFFYHFFPDIDWHYSVQLARSFPTLNVRLNFPVVGFMYFVNLNVSFSIWFFFLLSMLEEGIFSRLGLGVTESDWFVWGLPSVSWQSWGAFVVMVLWGLWMARRHLLEVLRQAWRPRGSDGERELLSYRTAVLAVILGLAYMLCWLLQAGMSWTVATVFLAGVLIAYLGITRLVIQAGLYYLTTPVVSQAMTMMTLGTASIAPQGLVALGLTYSFFGDVQSIFMPAAAHAGRLHGFMRLRGRGLCAAILLAVITGFALAIANILYMGYDLGASNFNSWVYRVSSGAGVTTFNDVVARIKDPAGLHPQKLAFFGAGAAAMSLLTFLQYRFPWWPLHPIGLTVASLWMIRNIAAAIFLSWAAKSIIMRFGGFELYRRAAPFFIGLILGHFLGVGISFFVDWIFFPGNGHFILHG